MSGKIRKNNLIAFWLAVISSIFLFMSSTSGVRNWVKIQEIILEYANFQFINILFIIILIIASFGGLAVLIGGFLILKRNVIWGNIFISLGSGVGLLGFLFNLLILIITFKIPTYFYLSFSSLGIIFAILAQIFSGKKKKIRLYKKFVNLFSKK